MSSTSFFFALDIFFIKDIIERKAKPKDIERITKEIEELKGLSPKISNWNVSLYKIG